MLQVPGTYIIITTDISLLGQVGYLFLFVIFFINNIIVYILTFKTHKNDSK